MGRTMPQTLEDIKAYIDDPEHKSIKEDLEFLFNFNNPNLALYKQRGHTKFSFNYRDLPTYYSAMISHYHLEDWPNTGAIVNFLLVNIYLVHTIANYVGTASNKILAHPSNSILQYSLGAAGPMYTVVYALLDYVSFNFWHVGKDKNAPGASSYLNVKITNEVNYSTYLYWDGDYDTILDKIKLKVLVSSAWIDAKRTTVTDTATNLLLGGGIFKAAETVINKIKVQL